MKAKEAGEVLPGMSLGMNENRIQLLEELGFVWTLRGEPKRELDTLDSAAIPSYAAPTAIAEDAMGHGHGPSQVSAAMNEERTYGRIADV